MAGMDLLGNAMDLPPKTFGEFHQKQFLLKIIEKIGDDSILFEQRGDFFHFSQTLLSDCF